MMKAVSALLLALVLAAALPSAAAQAFDFGDTRQAQNGDRGRDLVAPLAPMPPRERNQRGQNRARDAVKRGEILPLEAVAQKIQRRYPGRLLDVRLDESGRRPIYHLKMLTRDGRVMRLAVDARNAQVLGIAGQ